MYVCYMLCICVYAHVCISVCTCPSRVCINVCVCVCVCTHTYTLDAPWNCPSGLEKQEVGQPPGPAGSHMRTVPKPSLSLIPPANCVTPRMHLRATPSQPLSRALPPPPPPRALPTAGLHPAARAPVPTWLRKGRSGAPVTPVCSRGEEAQGRAKTWARWSHQLKCKPPRRLSAGERVDNKWQVHTGGRDLVIKSMSPDRRPSTGAVENTRLSAGGRRSSSGSRSCERSGTGDV